MQKQRRKVFAALEELFFTVKITDAAKRAGMPVEFIKNADEVVEKAKAERPALIIVDLNYNALQPLELIRRLKGEPELKGVSVIGYLSHIQGELKQKAHETGIDMVLARAALSQNLAQILKRHAGTA